MSALPNIPDHTLLRPIGRGSYGEVWLARNVMGTFRAVKIIWRRQFDSARPFEREFSGIQRYEPVSRSSGGLVHVLHVGRNEEEGYFYYVMELADGAAEQAEACEKGDDATRDKISPASYSPRTLRADLKRHERLATADCLRLALDVVSGLAQLHRHGLIHRDVKPGNIIYANNRAKLADIGLVSAGGEARTFVGTEGYIPPEGPGSPRADLYALGIALYEASTGYPPEQFPDVPADWLAEGASDDALEFHEVILKACEAQREHRYQSAEQMQADLALLQSGQSVSRMRALERRYARLRVVGLVGTTFLACALAGLLFSNYRARVAAASRARESTLRQQAEESLFKSRLAEAAASRRTGRAGQRFDALAAISDAARLKPGSPELRDEAIAALATVDVREVWRQPLIARIYHVSAITDGAMRWMVDATNDFILRVRDLRTWNTLGTFPKGPDLIDRIGPVSLDGKFLRVRYINGDRWVWDVQRCEPVLKNPAKEFVEGGGFACGGFVSLTKQGEALWQSLDGGSNRALVKLTVPAAATSPSPDGTAMLVVNSTSDLLTIVSLSGGKTNVNIAAPPGTRFTSAAWSPDGRRLAGAASNFRIYIWDARTNGPPLATLRGHTAEVVALAFHPDGRLLATGSWDNTTRLWDWMGERALLQWDGSTGWLWFSDDGTRLTFNRSVASERVAFIALEVAWPTACRTFHEPRPTDNPSGNKGPRGAAFSPDGHSLATATWNGVRCYDPRDGSLTRWTPSSASCVSFAGQPMELFAAGMEGAWRQKLVSESGAPLWDDPRPFPNERARFIAVSSDAETIAVVVHDKVELQHSDASSVRLPGKPAFEEVAVSADGKWVAAAPIGGTPGEVHLWKAAHAILHHRFPATRLAHIAFDPTGTRLAINHGESLTVWNTETGQRVWEIPRGERFERVGGVAYSADGRLLAACVSLRSVVLVAADDGRIVAKLEAPHGSAPGSVAFSPDGSQLAVMLADHEWQLWDLRTLRTELARLGLNWDEGAERLMQ